ncbi:MAG: oxygen-independent coproporphyrinogen III oxidase [Myxococcales bacterium]|nr:MAG: oxygen-independent coproporphyrinogen III oxidase [Myxococcales bacterium]
MSEPRYVIPPNPARVPLDLLARYTTRGPRYTSYPTAPQFKADIDREALFARWREGDAAAPPAGLSLYVHVPFCQRRCTYCGCYTHVASNPAAADGYVESLVREFELAAQVVDPARPVAQLAFGGGTPTFLPPDRLAHVLERLWAVWRFEDGAERSIELDPRSVSEEHIALLARYGFNRFSLGVQDFNPEVQRIINRVQPYERVAEVVEALHKAGRTAINFDLIYGLPGQTPDSIAETARRAITLAPTRIALFGYAHVPWMQMHQKALERYGLPDPPAKLALFGAAYDVFVEAGFVPVGMDHFARPDDELVKALAARSLHRNFMGYTTRRGLDLIAFGASGISAVSATYAQNLKELRAYAEAIAADRLPIERGYLLSDEDRLRRELIIDLFCNFHLDGAAFGAKWGVDFAAHFADELGRLAPLVGDGIVELDGATIRVTPFGRAFIRNVCMTFDQYLEADADKRRYSQTV